ncbi:MAG: autotransporter-associated beta strand repeat-containing protein, partial [Spirochaetota bacterium]
AAITGTGSFTQAGSGTTTLSAANSYAGNTTIRFGTATGGGAVFHDAEITYSLVVPEGHALAPPDILESYRLICAGLIAGIGLLGVESAFAPINDLVSGGKKISGNAQTRRKGCLLQHGTLLLDVDVEKMFALLLVPQEKMKGRLIEDVKARVTGLRGLLGRQPGYAEAFSCLASGFASAWDAELVPGQPSSKELARAEELARNKYGTEEWRLKR